MEAIVYEDDDLSKGAAERGLRVISVNAGRVRAALEDLRSLLPDDAEPDDGTVKHWRMDEVQLTLELSSEGGVRLVGSAEVGVKGGVTVTFKRLS